MQILLPQAKPRVSSFTPFNRTNKHTQQLDVIITEEVAAGADYYFVAKTTEADEEGVSVCIMGREREGPSLHVSAAPLRLDPHMYGYIYINSHRPTPTGTRWDIPSPPRPGSAGCSGRAFSSNRKEEDERRGFFRALLACLVPCPKTSFPSCRRHTYYLVSNDFQKLKKIGTREQRANR